MSGHSKWSTIKHKKAATDAKRSRIWTKLIKEITVAARMGGGDINGNPRLRAAVDKGKQANMPNDNIDRAIKKGTGDLDGVNYEEIIYEGYGPGGAAVLVEVLTDNKNRTVGEIRHMFEKAGGNLGASGSVAWMFKKRGLVVIEKAAGLDEDRIMEIALEAGADDVRDIGEGWEVEMEPGALEAVRAAFAAAKVPVASSETSMIPGNSVHLDAGKAESMLKLIGALEDSDDVQNVYANHDIDDDVRERLEG